MQSLTRQARALDRLYRVAKHGKARRRYQERFNVLAHVQPRLTLGYARSDLARAPLLDYAGLWGEDASYQDKHRALDSAWPLSLGVHRKR